MNNYILGYSQLFQAQAFKFSRHFLLFSDDYFWLIQLLLLALSSY